MNEPTEGISPSPPPAICSDRVLRYARLDDSVGYNVGHGLMFVDGKELGKVLRLAICQPRNTSGVMLHYCDWDWTPIGAASFESVAAAERRAERMYPGSSARWSDSTFSESDVTEYLDEIWRDSRCGFCGKTPDETGAATFTKGQAVICAKCVAEFHAAHDDT